MVGEKTGESDAPTADQLVDQPENLCWRLDAMQTDWPTKLNGQLNLFLQDLELMAD
ncbi:hypothetical protein PGT21_033172 [Puccinia graminis f. sp. tritici]|uniref:Uncharacterized protein n=1 Tax=Puccinia graminis f. sp. tritici TaxID=56615 RepID=A0A5B0MJ17_PUCGR|nr:hypothetical protein PGTUg99_034648 [Puccinia graminis f. sp. tritici]KAA1091410.1 hypothetical protein PGT21_033172 [Puccinia graminis f. sp. tritici]